MTKYAITEVGRSNTYVYGVGFVICGNAEELTGGTADPSGNGWSDEAAEAFGEAAGVIRRAGFDYAEAGVFRDWNGGRYYRKAHVHAEWWRAPIEVEGEGDEAEEVVGDWERCEASDVPAEFRADAETAEGAALNHLADTMERLISEGCESLAEQDEAN